MERFTYSDPYVNPATGETDSPAARLSSAQRYADSVRESIARGASMMDLDAIVAREDLARIGEAGYVGGRRLA